MTIPTYDSTWLDKAGIRQYERDQALGTGGGPAWWSDTHHHNPDCGCHLAAYCRGCNTCMNCDRCYCYDTMDLAW